MRKASSEQPLGGTTDRPACSSANDGAHGAAAIVVRPGAQRGVLQPGEAALELAAELRQRVLHLRRVAVEPRTRAHRQRCVGAAEVPL